VIDRPCTLARSTVIGVDSVFGILVYYLSRHVHKIPNCSIKLSTAREDSLFYFLTYIEVIFPEAQRLNFVAHLGKKSIVSSLVSLRW